MAASLALYRARSLRWRRIRLVILLAGLIAADAAAAEVERRLFAMGTELVVTVSADTRPAALAASERAVAAIAAVERRLSTWRPDSELTRLNAAPVGVPVPLSAPLAADLAEVQRLWRATGGAFDPAVGSLVRAWGLREGGRRPGAAELGEARRAGDFGRLALTGRSATRLAAGLILEEGGFAKGVGLDAALEAARGPGVGRVVVDLGGQLAVVGGALELDLVAPRDRSRRLARVRVASGSVATSGNGERGAIVDGARVGHILDPRTGRPARDFGSLTVWAPAATEADALATGLYVLGPDAALEWAAAHPGIEVAVVEDDVRGLRVRATPGLAAIAVATAIPIETSHGAVAGRAQGGRP